MKLVKLMRFSWEKSILALMCALLLHAGAAMADPPAPVAETGQITSYAAGDDGDNRAGAAWPSPRFVDNHDGSATDRLTGLVWLTNANCFGAVTWQEALKLAQSLKDGSCGLSDRSVPGDWRLPNVLELVGLVDFGNHLPAIASGHPFANLQFDFYWSATTLDNVNSPARPVSVAYGNVDQEDKADLLYAWPVRDAR